MAEKKRPIQIEEVGPTGIYPASGPWPPGDAEVVGQGELGRPHEQHENADKSEEGKESPHD